MATSILAIFTAWTNGCSATSMPTLLNKSLPIQKHINLCATRFKLISNAKNANIIACAEAADAKEQKKTTTTVWHTKDFLKNVCRYLNCLSMREVEIKGVQRFVKCSDNIVELLLSYLKYFCLYAFYFLYIFKQSLFEFPLGIFIFSISHKILVLSRICDIVV